MCRVLGPCRDVNIFASARAVIAEIRALPIVFARYVIMERRSHHGWVDGTGEFCAVHLFPVGFLGSRPSQYVFQVTDIRPFRAVFHRFPFCASDSLVFNYG